MRDPDYDALHARGKSLEDAFFHERDRQLAEAIQRKLTAEEKELALAAAIGISDRAAIQQITRTEAGVPVLSALALLPLVEVAWCDGDVAAKEQQAVLQAAVEMGIAADSPAYQFLTTSLQQRPSREAVAAWKEYVQAICATLDPPTVARLKTAVVGRAEKIAQAAGGILGFGNKISPDERACLDDLSAAFG